MRQNSAGVEDARLMVGDANWNDYTLSLKARKTGGDEGFLIMFQVPNSESKSWLNLGGWDNTNFTRLEVPGIDGARVNGQHRNRSLV